MSSIFYFFSFVVSFAVILPESVPKQQMFNKAISAILMGLKEKIKAS